jgi:hypothetical protein
MFRRRTGGDARSVRRGSLCARSCSNALRGTRRPPPPWACLCRRARRRRYPCRRSRVSRARVAERSRGSRGNRRHELRREPRGRARRCHVRAASVRRGRRVQPRRRRTRCFRRRLHADPLATAEGEGLRTATGSGQGRVARSGGRRACFHHGCARDRRPGAACACGGSRPRRAVQGRGKCGGYRARSIHAEGRCGLGTASAGDHPTTRSGRRAAGNGDGLAGPAESALAGVLRSYRLCSGAIAAGRRRPRTCARRHRRCRGQRQGCEKHSQDPLAGHCAHLPSVRHGAHGRRRRSRPTHGSPTARSRRRSGGSGCGYPGNIAGSGKRPKERFAWRRWPSGCPGQRG